MNPFILWEIAYTYAGLSLKKALLIPLQYHCLEALDEGGTPSGSTESTPSVCQGFVRFDPVDWKLKRDNQQL